MKINNFIKTLKCLKKNRLHFLRNINICFKIIGYPNVKKQL